MKKNKNINNDAARKDLLTQEETAHYLGVTTATIRRYRKRGILHCVNLSTRKVVFRRAEIEKMLNSNTED